MNAIDRYGNLVAAGLLILQLTLAATALQISPNGTATAQGAVERSREETRKNPNFESAGGAAEQPGKADDRGEPALGGQRHPLYRLSVLDAVEVSFTLTPEFNQVVTVRPDGYISLSSGGDVVAEGLTLPELRDKILQAYAGILHDPEVTIRLKEFERPYFIASGQVGHPGKYEFRGDLTVNEAVAIAGGFTTMAKHSQVVLFRRISGETAEAHVLDLKQMLNRLDLREDMHLRPGDFVYVPQNRISKLQKFIPINSPNWYLNPLQF